MKIYVFSQTLDALSAKHEISELPLFESNSSIDLEQDKSITSLNITQSQVLSRFTKKLIEKNFITASTYSSYLLKTAISESWNILQNPNAGIEFFLPHILGLMIALVWSIQESSAFFKDCSQDQMVRLKKGIKFFKYSLTHFTQYGKHNKLCYSIGHSLEKVKKRTELMEKIFNDKYNTSFKYVDFECENLTSKNEDEIKEEREKDPKTNAEEPETWSLNSKSTENAQNHIFYSENFKIYPEDFYEDIILKMIRNSTNKKRIWTISGSVGHSLLLKRENKCLSSYFDLTIAKKMEITMNILEYLCVLFNEAEIKLEAQRDAVFHVNRLGMYLF